MRPLLLLSFVSLAFASVEDNVPACALTCIRSNQDSNCPATNPNWFVCHCADGPWLKLVVECAAKSCSQNDWELAMQQGYQGASAAGYKLASPDVVVKAIGANVGEKTLPKSFPGITFASTYPDPSYSTGGSPAAATTSASPSSTSAVSNANSTGPSGSGDRTKAGIGNFALALLAAVFLGMLMV